MFIIKIKSNRITLNKQPDDIRIEDKDQLVFLIREAIHLAFRYAGVFVEVVKNPEDNFTTFLIKTYGSLDFNTKLSNIVAHGFSYINKENSSGIGSFIESLLILRSEWDLYIKDALPEDLVMINRLKPKLECKLIE